LAAVLEQCDETIAIPMPPHVDSLNVGSASAVFLYEAARQRGDYGKNLLLSRPMELP
jgi:tRNA G18 (ribose-2'-O)-methylase SpoU